MELILLEGSGDEEGNRLLDRFEKHTGLIGEPLRRDQSRRYETRWETFEQADAAVARISRRSFSDPNPFGASAYRSVSRGSRNGVPLAALTASFRLYDACRAGSSAVRAADS
jgi:hypothetical protein